MGAGLEGAECGKIVEFEMDVVPDENVGVAGIIIIISEDAPVAHTRSAPRPAGLVISVKVPSPTLSVPIVAKHL